MAALEIRLKRVNKIYYEGVSSNCFLSISVHPNFLCNISAVSDNTGGRRSMSSVVHFPNMERIKLNKNGLLLSDLFTVFNMSAQ